MRNRTRYNEANIERINGRYYERLPGKADPAFLKNFRLLGAASFGRPRFKNPVVGGVEDLITQPMYDSVSFAAAAAFAAQTMFQVGKGQAGKTLAQTNMTASGGILPNPQRMTIRAVRFFIANNTVITDLANLLQDVSFSLQIGTKPYLQGPLLLLTAGCGAMVTAAAQVGTAPAGSAPLFATSNGVPDQRSIFSLNQPIPWEQGEQLQFILNADIAFNFAAASANPAGVGTTLYPILDGDIYRAVQ